MRKVEKKNGAGVGHEKIRYERKKKKLQRER